MQEYLQIIQDSIPPWMQDPQVQALGLVLATMGLIGHYIIKEPKKQPDSNLAKRVEALERRINQYEMKRD